MPVDAETKRLLLRWQALTKPGEFQRTKSMVTKLWILGLVVLLLDVAAIEKEFSPLIIAFGGMIVGWIVAETNALRARIATWEKFQHYLSWPRIEQDIEDAT